MAKKVKAVEERTIDIANKKLKFNFSCMKCKEKVEVVATTLIKKGNRVRVTSKHKNCGTNLSVFTSMEKVKELTKGAK